MTEDKYIYQIGNFPDPSYIFDKVGLRFEVLPSIKTFRENSGNFDGTSRTNLSGDNLLGDKKIKLDFIFTDNQNGVSNGYLRRVFNRSIKPIFLYSKDNDGNIAKWFWTLVEITQPLTQPQKDYEELGLTKRKYTTELNIVLNYFFECQPEDLKYFSESDYRPDVLLNGSATLNGSQLLDNDQSFYYKGVNTLSQANQLSIFDTDTPNIFLRYSDKFIEQKYLDMNSTSGVVIGINGETTTTQAYTKLRLDTDVASPVFMLEILPISKNKTIEITNLDNGSDIIIEWVGIEDYDYSSTLIFNSYHKKFYDFNSKKEIDNSRIQYSYTNELLYFDPWDSKVAISPPVPRLKVTNNDIFLNQIIINILNQYE